MRIRYVLFLIIILCCSGCSVVCDFDIDSLNNIDEKINISADNSLDIEKIKDFNYYVPISYLVDDYSAFESEKKGLFYYNFSKNNDNSNMKFSYSYDIDDIKDDFFAHRCFEYVAFKKNSLGNKGKSELILSTSNKFLCFDRYDNLDNVIVNVYSKYKLKDTNADDVDGHKYTWKFDRNNYNDKFIYLLLDTTVRDLNFWERLLEGDSLTIFALFIIIFVFLGIVILLFKKRGQMRNKV